MFYNYSGYVLLDFFQSDVSLSDLVIEVEFFFFEVQDVKLRWQDIAGELLRSSEAVFVYVSIL